MEFFDVNGPIVNLCIGKHKSTKLITDTDKALDLFEISDGYFRIVYPDNEDLPVPITPELEALGCEA